MSQVPLEKDPNADLGFGSVVARESRRRLLNRDGSFNVRRRGLRFWQSLSLYHSLLTVSWHSFFWIVVAAYVGTNTLFASLYLACGPGALGGIPSGGSSSRFLQAFFFSVQTLATIGYGHVSPSSLAANLLVTAEALVGLIGIALVTGITFARFSRPTAQIIFSRFAVIGPYRETTAFMFRIANQRNNQLVELKARLLLSRLRPQGGERDFHFLALERDRVTFFPLFWTIVHPIDEKSPLYGLTAEQLRQSGAEFLILLTGVDETFAQTVHARSSYQSDEIIFGAKFKSIFNPPDEDGIISVDIQDLHSVERPREERLSGIREISTG